MFLLRVGLDGVARKALVLQLSPTIETFKTAEHVNFFKSNNINEMIYVQKKDTQ
jgi:hypothetical protein